MSRLDRIEEVNETTSPEEATRWLSYNGIHLLSVAQDPHGVAHYVIGKDEGILTPPWYAEELELS